MKAIYLVRGGHLVPDEPEAIEALARIPEDTRVVVEAHKPRGENGLYQLRKWWKLMSILADNMPVFAADPRHASDMVLIACHECDWRVDPRTGHATPQARSLALDRMEDEVFERLWRRAIFYINANWIPIGTAKLEAEIAEFFAGPERRSLGKRVVREREMESA